MTDVPDEYLPEVFERALCDYVDVDKPFGVTQLRAAWQEMQNEMRAEMLKAETTDILADLKTMAECSHEYRIEAPRAEDAAIFESLRVCQRCGHTVPKFLKSGGAAVAVLQMAQRA